jgi:hypothetical protein
MKRMSIGVLLLMGTALLPAQTAPQAGAAIIREVTGTVEVKGPGALAWEAAAGGQALERAALISTGFNSTARIGIGNSTITVRPLTRLSLEELAAAPGTERVTVNLRAGRVRAEVKPPAGGTVDFSVRSPTATASVRGTVFEFDGTRLTVEAGRVHLGGQRVMGAYIGPGHATAADPETGKTVPAAERLKAELSPALPSGVDAVPAGPAAAAVPAGAGLGFGFDWLEE